MNTIEEIFNLFARRGGEAYFGEPVSQLEHALQTARHAEAAGAPDALIVAALLHDIGHLIHQLPEDIADHGIDARHEEIGARWLARYFPASVSEPARLHVAAKRYLCTTDAQYRQKLSPASIQSLELQGGPMSEDECGKFAAQPYAREAVRLRRWDEMAKVAGAKTPGLDWHQSRLEKMMAFTCANQM
ncbi:MAG: phosphonate degradation HD-domain oxygenase [Acidobacteriota bacterium]